MKAIKNYQFKSENIQNKMEEKMGQLLEGALKDKDDYQKEKALDMFAQTILYLESTLLYQNEVHPHKLDPKMMMDQKKMKEYFEKTQEIEKILENEINRSYRFFNIFL